MMRDWYSGSPADPNALNGIPGTVPSWGDAYSMDFVTTGTCPAGHAREVER